MELLVSGVTGKLFQPCRRNLPKSCGNKCVLTSRLRDYLGFRYFEVVRPARHWADRFKEPPNARVASGFLCLIVLANLHVFRLLCKF